MAVRADRGVAVVSPLRTAAVAGGFLCAVLASVTLFITDNPDVLRIGILVALWAFGLAALVAGRRQTEQAVAADAELEVRKTYELELEREVAARREYELALEATLRRELQEDFTAQIGALREEMTRLRRELSEQWDSELRVERMVMHTTQSVRMGADRREPLEHESTGRASLAAGPPSDTEHLDRYQPRRDDFPARPFEPDPPTQEFATVSSVALSVPTGPLPPPSPLSSPNGPRSPRPPSPGFPILINTAPPPTQTAPGSAQPASTEATDDVLARILAEAGAGVGGRRRKHRYADEDD